MPKSTSKRSPGKSNTKELESQSVKIDLPIWMIKALDDKAHYLGISRKAAINVFLANGLNRGVHTLNFSDKSDYEQLNTMLSPEWNSSEDEEAFRDLGTLRHSSVTVSLSG